MKKALIQEVEIPEGIEVSIDGNFVKVKGPEGEESKEFNFGKVKVEKKENKILLSNPKATKREKKIMNTSVAHLKNMMKGIGEKFVYELKVCSSHFPITIEINGNIANIKNFLGEKSPRKVKLPEGVDIQINKDQIIVKGTNKEVTGQACANLEKITRMKTRDKRIFQDGIYIIKKDGKEI